MVNIAVIGVGQMGKNHVRILSSMKNCYLKAVCDKNVEKAARVAKQYNTVFYSDYKRLLKGESIDAVVIAVPTKLHKVIALDFIENRISVLIEKPIALNFSESQKIVKAASKAGVVLAVGHVERFNPAVVKLQELVKKNYFGEILSIVVRRVGLFPPRVKDVDVVTDLSVHDLDIVTNIMGGNPKMIFARGSKTVNAKIDHAEIFLDYGKFGCFIQANWVTPIKIRNLSITGKKAYVELNYITQKLEAYKTKSKDKTTRGFEDFVAEYGKSEKLNIKTKNIEPLKLELLNFVESIEKKKTPKVSGEDGLNAIKLAEVALKSIRYDRPIKIT